MLNRVPMLFTSVAIGFVLASAALVIVGSEVKARPMTVSMPVSAAAEPAAPGSLMVREMYDRAIGKVGAQSLAGEISKLNRLLQDGEFRTAKDFLLGAIVAAHGTKTEHALLAHDLAVCALAMGEIKASEWVAVSQDQLLMRMGKSQRFGTQESRGKLFPVHPAVTDSMRHILGIPALQESKRLLEKGKGLERPVVISAAEKPVPVPMAIAAE